MQFQLICYGLGEAIDINFNAMKFVMDLLKIENRPDCFKRVRGIFQLVQQARKILQKKD